MFFMFLLGGLSKLASFGIFDMVFIYYYDVILDLPENEINSSHNQKSNTGSKTLNKNRLFA